MPDIFSGTAEGGRQGAVDCLVDCLLNMFLAEEDVLGRQIGSFPVPLLAGCTVQLLVLPNVWEICPGLLARERILLGRNNHPHTYTYTWWISKRALPARPW